MTGEPCFPASKWRADSHFGWKGEGMVGAGVAAGIVTGGAT